MAMKMPPRAMIGAVMAIEQTITPSSWTCWTSLVMRVISDGAPSWLTSRWENDVTRWKRSLRTSRPKPIAALAETYMAPMAKTIWMPATPSMTPPSPPDVVGVAGEHAVVDDLGVDGRQQQRAARLHDLQDEQQDQQPAVAADEVAAEEADQHGRATSREGRAGRGQAAGCRGHREVLGEWVRMPSSRSETSSSGGTGPSGSKPGLLVARASERRRRAAISGSTRSWSA